MLKKIKRIKLDDNLNELFLAFLKKRKFVVPIMGPEKYELISYISEFYLLSGFILKSCTFDVSQRSLFRKLELQRELTVLKHMIFTFPSFC